MTGRPPPATAPAWPSCLAIALVAVLADLISKCLVVANIRARPIGVRLLGGALYLVQARNSGAAFSVGTGATVVLTGDLGGRGR